MWQIGMIEGLMPLVGVVAQSTWARAPRFPLLSRRRMVSVLYFFYFLRVVVVVVVVFRSQSALADVRRARKAVYLWTSACGTCVLLLLAVPQIVEHSYVRILAVSLGVLEFRIQNFESVS